jgi:hypothetical protein
MKKETRGRKPLSDKKDSRKGITVTAKERHHAALKPLLQKFVLNYERKHNSGSNPAQS